MLSKLKNEKTFLQFVRRNQRDNRELTLYSALHRFIVTIYVSLKKYLFYFYKN